MFENCPGDNIEKITTSEHDGGYSLNYEARQNASKLNQAVKTINAFEKRIEACEYHRSKGMYIKISFFKEIIIFCRNLHFNFQFSFQDSPENRMTLEVLTSKLKLSNCKSPSAMQKQTKQRLRLDLQNFGKVIWIWYTC